jgi:glycosyltransferase involved in cell wall biosynthesis
MFPVLHIIKSLGRGGAEILLPETLRHHDQQQYRFHYIYFLPWKNQVVADIQQAGGTVVNMPANNNLQILRKVRQIAAYIKRHNIQVIHCHLPWAGIVGRLAGLLTGIPVIYTEHNKWERYHTITYFANKFSFSRQQQVIAVSAEVAQSIRKHYSNSRPDVKVVLNGIDTIRFSPIVSIERNIRKELGISPTATVIGITCVFRAQKRLTIWLEIAARLHSMFPGLIFLVVGDGILKKEIHEKAKELSLNAFVHFTGLQTDTRPYLKAMDIFMMSSEFEGLPIALLEAMSMGCMPACTSAGGIPEVINDSVNGLLVPVNDPLQLADRIAACLSQPESIANMKRSARETVVSSFDMKKMVHTLETIYTDVINR